MTFEQWKATRKTHDVCDLDESEFHELTGHVFDESEFSFGDYAPDSLVTYQDRAWIEAETLQREGATVYTVTIGNIGKTFAELSQAESWLWENHSKDNYDNA